MATVDSANTLTEYVDALQSRGRYTFTRAEAKQKTGKSEEGMKKSIHRLKRVGALSVPKKGFVFVPLEYKSSGCPPASWFIDDVMDFLDHPCYVGILTTAEIHGAAHRPPQVFQDVTNDVIRAIEVKGIRIKFLKRKNFNDTLREEKQSLTGYFDISTPEATAFDLLYFRKSAVGYDKIATVLSELSLKINPGGSSCSSKYRPFQINRATDRIYSGFVRRRINGSPCRMAGRPGSCSHSSHPLP